MEIVTIDRSRWFPNFFRFGRDKGVYSYYLFRVMRALEIYFSRSVNGTVLDTVEFYAIFPKGD